MSCASHQESDLIEVLRASAGYDVDAVARWCPTCGAIVVDGELDNRTYPGKYMKMRGPKSAPLERTAKP